MISGRRLLNARLRQESTKVFIQRTGKLVIYHTAAIPINDHEQIQRLERIKAGSAWSAGDFVFTSAIGSSPDRNNPGRTYRIILNQAGLKTRGLHTLRLTFATNRVQGGHDRRTLSELLVHSKVAFTMQIYVHSDISTKMKGMDRMERLL